jgi:basic amino acid/polyamine antiporter, APA family
VSVVAPVRHLGRFRLAAVGINSVIGGGIFILPATVARLVGPASLATYVLAGLVVLGVGLSLASLASRFETSGGPYLYVHRTFGAFAGFQIGWLFCLARLTAMASLLSGFALYVGALVPGGSENRTRAALVILCALFVVGTNVAGIRQTSGATNLLAVAKIAPLIVLGVAGLFFIKSENFVATPYGPTEFLRAVLLLIFAFSGFEILTVPAEESHQPRRDMPFALIATILTVCVLYLVVHTVALGMLPNLAAEKAPLASAAGIMAGSAGRYAMTLVAAFSTAGCSLASMVGGSRILYAMSSARQIPSWIGALEARLRTPVVASLLMGVLATVLAIAAAYDRLAAVSAGTRLLVYLACCLACLRRTAAAGEVGGRKVAAATAAAILALLCGLEGREAMAGLAGIAFGTLLYLGARRGRVALEARGEIR